MGLAGTKVKQRFGLDPRNTNWSNNNNQFGHQYLTKMGWTPGKGIGLVPDSITTHLKINIKTDNAGLGAKLQKRNKDANELDECSGVDAFQRILGRLNGKEDAVNKVMDMKRDDMIINGKMGIRFVKGEVLSSTWDKEKKALISYANDKNEGKKDKDEVSLLRKRKVDDEEKREVKKSRKDIKEKKEKKKKKEKKEKKEKKKKKEKSDKKEKKEKKEKSDKKEKKEKKEKKDKLDKESSNAANVESTKSLVSDSSRESTPTPIASRLSVRSKWIKQKRASVMDAKALNEIFMISN